MAENEGNAGLQRWSKVFNEDFPGMLVRVMAAGSMDASNLAPKFRAAALDRALEVLSNYDRMPDTVQTLCDLAGASWSTKQGTNGATRISVRAAPPRLTTPRRRASRRRGTR